MRAASVASVELAGEIGWRWLVRADGWEAEVAELVARARPRTTSEAIERADRTATRQRDAAEPRRGEGPGRARRDEGGARPGARTADGGRAQVRRRHPTSRGAGTAAGGPIGSIPKGERPGGRCPRFGPRSARSARCRRTSRPRARASGSSTRGRAPASSAEERSAGARAPEHARGSEPVSASTRPP